MAQAVKNAGAAISITDLNNNIIYVNDAFTKIYGHNESELIGKNISFVHSQDNPKKILEEIRLGTAHGRWSGELINIKKDSTEFPIYLSTSNVLDTDGKPYALVGVAADITARCNVKKQLEE